MAVSVLCPSALMQKGFAVTDGAAQRQLVGCLPVSRYLSLEVAHSP